MATWPGESGAPGVVLPPYLPALPTGGLIAAARDALADPNLTPPEVRNRWQAGFAFAPGNCSGGAAIDPCDSADSLTIAANLGLVTYKPPVLWAGDHCSPNDRTRNYQERARQLLLNDRSRQLAREFWTGERAQAAGWLNNYLARDDNVQVVSVTPLDPVIALACLEDYLASCQGGRHMIHLTPGLLVHLFSQHVAERVGQLAVSPNGSIFVADEGYPGTGPHGQAPITGSVWMYGTNIVDVRIDDPPVIIPDLDAQALERTQDTFFYRAEQFAAATWSGCCHVAVPVNITHCTHTGGS